MTCIRAWGWAGLASAVAAVALGVCPAQDVACPTPSELDTDLAELKSGPRGKMREAMRRTLLLVYLKQKEAWLAASLEDDAAHLAGEVAFRRYLASVDLKGCPSEFNKAFRRYAKLLNSFDEKSLKTVADFPETSLQGAGRELFRVLLNYRLDPKCLMEEMKMMVDAEAEGKNNVSAGQMIVLVQTLREELQSGKRPFPEERPEEELEEGA